MEIAFDIRRSLMELDPEGWTQEALPDDLPQAMFRVGQKPVRKLNAAELYHLLRFHLSLAQVAPLALERLETDPLLTAERHPGDLLTALMESDSRFWHEQEELWGEVLGIAASALESIQARMEKEELGDYLPSCVGDDFMGALLHFRGLHP